MNSVVLNILMYFIMACSVMICMITMIGQLGLLENRIEKLEKRIDQLERSDLEMSRLMNRMMDVVIKKQEGGNQNVES